MNDRPPVRSLDLAVSCRGLSKSFKSVDGPINALRDVDFEVARGELVMIVGPSGCGKTTLISVIAAMLSQDKGDCRVLGENLTQLSEREKSLFRRDGMGFVFQSYNLIPTITIAENVAVPLLLSGVSRKRARSMASAILDRLGLAKKLNAWPSQLSGGQQQRVSIARALVHTPSLVICDEPTSALDHATGRNVMELLRATMCLKGKSLIIVTHDNRIFPFADRIVEMDDGKIIGSSIRQNQKTTPRLAIAQ
jgi:putative ABC transport system ATP-binding protein